MYNYLLKLTGHPEDAMDLCQETFLKGYRSLDRLDDPARFGPWLYRIAHNEAISHLRRARPSEELGDPAAGGAGFQRMAPVEVTLAVEAALKRLPPEQREAVILKVYEGFKFDEIAAILDCPPSTVKSRVYTGLEQLKLILAPVARDPGGGAVQ
jgi:RNA polymerase sigma-70 factor (ECF subfamily)